MKHIWKQIDIALLSEYIFFYTPFTDPRDVMRGRYAKMDRKVSGV